MLAAVLNLDEGPRALAPHLHVPLQSGSDRVLRAMRRPYTAAMYRDLVERLASAIPRLGLGADVIAGFPGESGEDFAETLALVEALPFSYLHVFPYSPRAGTEVAGRPGRVDAATAAERGRRLREAAADKNRRFRANMLGRVEDVLVLEARDRTTRDLVGLTGNYMEVTFPGPDGLRRGLARVRITAVEAAASRGRLEEA